LFTYILSLHIIYIELLIAFYPVNLLVIHWKPK